MVIDTVTITPDEHRIDLVWRMLLAADVEFPDGPDDAITRGRADRAPR